MIIHRRIFPSTWGRWITPQQSFFSLKKNVEWIELKISPPHFLATLDTRAFN